jgi:adenosine kinase
MDIVLTGSIAFDYLMHFPGYFRDHILPDHLDAISLSFLVESMVRQRGGIAPNIAYTLALLGEHPKLWATVGEDFEEYRLWLEGVGIDTSGARVVPGIFTASFFVNTDRANSQIASFYPGAMAYASNFSLQELASNPPDLIVVSPNDPAAMILFVIECQEMGIPYIYDPSQQIVRLTGEDLRLGITGAKALFVNDYEYALIQKMTGLRAETIIQDQPGGFVVITHGEKGASVFSNGDVLSIPVVPPECIRDPTGVGDAFRGGFLTGYSRGFDLLTCGQMGSLAAAYCLEQSGPQGHSFTPQEFVARYRTQFDDQGTLDVLSI